MEQFGQYLLDRGVIDQQQLDEALHHHVLVGVRLGSCLAELGFVSINVIAKRLSEFHRAPLPPRDWLEKPDINAVKSVTRGLVERHRFVPLKLASAQSIRVVPEAEIDFRLLRALGRDQVCEAAIFPVVLKQRVVNLLYVDNGAYPIALSTFSALQTLVECASSAYTNLIKKRKEDKSA